MIAVTFFIFFSFLITQLTGARCRFSVLYFWWKAICISTSVKNRLRATIKNQGNMLTTRSIFFSHLICNISPAMADSTRQKKAMIIPAIICLPLLAFNIRIKLFIIGLSEIFCSEYVVLHLFCIFFYPFFIIISCI